MTYQAATHAAPALTDATRAYFLDGERIVFLLGALGVGGLTGFVIALATGVQDVTTQVLVSGPVLLVALYLTCATYAEAGRRAAWGCMLMAACHAAALVAWPIFMTLQPANYAWAPTVAMGSAVLLASCWSGSPAAIYRTAAQGVLVAALAGHQGALLVFGT